MCRKWLLHLRHSQLFAGRSTQTFSDRLGAGLVPRLQPVERVRKKLGFFIYMG